MELDYDYTKKPSSNANDKFFLSFDGDGELWSPGGNDEDPSISVVISEAGDDTYIDSVVIDKTENVKSISVVVVDENGDKVSDIVAAPVNFLLLMSCVLCKLFLNVDCISKLTFSVIVNGLHCLLFH